MDQPNANRHAPRPAQRNRDTRYKHVYATHSVQRESSLSHDNPTNPSFKGFQNLIILILIVSNLRLIIENYRKYGVLICIRCHDYRETDVWGGVLLYLLVPCHLFIAWLIEKFAAVKARSALGQISKAREDGPARQTIIRRQHYTYWYIAALAHSVNALYLLRSATLWVYYDIHHPGIGTLCELHAIIICFKVCSYAFTNRDLRRAYLHPDVEEELPALYAECPYPNNITFRNLLYFWWAPTLIYQPVYPRRPTIRWWYVARCGAEIFVLGVAVWIASAQYATPLLQNSLDSIFSLDLVAMAERTMKLSTISVFCWLCGFYALFQSALNALAEIMQFGDRDFYGDWWNVSSVRTYWTSWNKPVTNFMRRHVYSPLVGRGVPPWLAQVIVFLISGVLHELLVGVPTHNILYVAFVGMIGQIPLIFLTDAVQRIRGLDGRVIGNMIFWVSFCILGQPLAAMLYFFAWHAKYGSVSKQYQESTALHMQFIKR